MLNFLGMIKEKTLEKVVNVYYCDWCGAEMHSWYDVRHEFGSDLCRNCSYNFGKEMLEAENAKREEIKERISIYKKNQYES